MSYLLDTNVVSEATKPHRDRNVASWLDSVPEDEMFVSVATFAEVYRGIELLPKGRKRDQLLLWFTEGLRTRFQGRILAIDQRVAEAWGVIMARGQRAGTPVAAMDGFFAATAEVHGLTLVTRDMRDFAKLGVALFNPWVDQP